MSVVRTRDRTVSPHGGPGSTRRGRRCLYERIKPGLDMAMALILLILSAPVIIAAMVLVRISSCGSVIYHQRRVGLGGKVFTIYKIRTMYQDCERHSGATWSLPGDPRVTPVGRVLRFTHLDELPQLINVLLGEMSLIGPRPERPDFLPELELALPGYCRRLTVQPGITGLAQVQQPPDTGLDSVRRKLDYDLCYVGRMGLSARRRASSLATGLKCVGVPFAWIGRLLMGVPRSPRVCREPEFVSRQEDLSCQRLAVDTNVGPA